MQIDARVLQGQVAALYSTVYSAALGDAVLAWALCAFLYWSFQDPRVLVWLVLHAMQLLRYPLQAAYHRDPQAASRSEFWARRQWRELLIYSSVWGLAPWLLIPANNLPMTVLIMLVVLGLCSTGVPSVAPRWASVLSFVVPMVVGLILAMVWQADAVHLFLATCGVVYLGATLHFARQQHLLLTNSLVMRFEKDALTEQLRIQVAIAQRISEDKTRFLAAASHDLRQPLHAIALFGAVLENELDGHPAEANAARLMQAVNVLGTSLDSMLDVARLDAGVVLPQVQDISVNSLFQSLNHVFSVKASEKSLQLRLRASPLWVRSDPQLLLRLLSNVVDNALKYTLQGGVVVQARARGEQVWIDVRDTGIGMADEQLERIFEEFYQIDNRGRDRTLGLGIGLSVVQRLSMLLGHDVQVRSRLGQGSLLRIVLPNTAPSEKIACLQSDSMQRLSVEKLHLPQRVLVIDDEIYIRAAMLSLLQSYGVDAEAVSDEAEADAALVRAAEQGLPYRALLCDYRLANGVDGLEVGQRLQMRFGPALALLLITGETAPDRLQQLRLSKVAVLFKPVGGRTLMQALADLAELAESETTA